MRDLPRPATVARGGVVLVGLAAWGCAPPTAWSPSAPVVRVDQPGPNPLARSLGVDLRLPSPCVVRCVADDDDADVLSVADPTVTRHHRLLLAGFRAGTTYHCAVNGSPLDLELPDLDLPELRAIGPGPWTAGVVSSLDHPSALVVWDGHARPRFVLWDLPAGTSSGRYVEPLGDELLVGGGNAPDTFRVDALGRTTWTAPPLDPGALYTHDGSVHDDRLLMLTLTDEDTYWGFGLEELALADDRPTFSWTSDDAVQSGVLPPPLVEDAYHANAARSVTDTQGDAVWVSLREQSLLLRIDRATGAITHQLGAGGDVRLVDPDGTELDAAEGFFGQHDPSFSGDDDQTVLMLDNGYHRPTTGEPWSRLLELDLDLEARTATVRWSWTTDGWYQAVMGGVERLPDGTILVTRATCPPCTGAVTEGARPGGLMLVDRVSGDVEWNVDVPADTWLYRNRVVDPCALFPALEQCH